MIGSELERSVNGSAAYRRVSTNVLSMERVPLDEASTQHQSDCTSEPGLRAIARGPQDCGTGERVAREFRLDDRAKSIPGANDVADDDDFLWRERRRDHADTTAEVGRYLLQKLE